MGKYSSKGTLISAFIGVSLFSANNYAGAEGTLSIQGGEVLNGHTMVPMRSIFQSLGASVTWDPNTQTITGQKGDSTVSLTINSKNATINSSPVKLDQEPYIKNGTTIVPARFVSEALGAKVSWDTSNQMVIINLGDKELHVTTVNPSVSTTSSFFTLGSTKQEVKNIMGEPDNIQQFGNVSAWQYGNSSIDFDTDETVAGWNNVGHNLNVSVGTKKDGAPSFTKGSSQSDVAAAMGTPDKITHWGALWYYDDSKVEIYQGKVMGYYNGSGNLKVN